MIDETENRKDDTLGQWDIPEPLASETENKKCPHCGCSLKPKHKKVLYGLRVCDNCYDNLRDCSITPYKRIKGGN